MKKYALIGAGSDLGVNVDGARIKCWKAGGHGSVRTELSFQ